MFGGFGWMEITMILIVAVIIFGHKLPDVSRNVGKSLRDLQNGLRNAKEDLDLDPRRLKNDLHDAIYNQNDTPTTDNEDFQVTEDPCDDPDEILDGDDEDYSESEESPDHDTEEFEGEGGDPGLPKEDEEKI